MRGRELLLGVTGGIAAYKTADLCSKLVQAGASVSVVMTEAAEQFIGATTFEALTGRPVHRGMFQPSEHFRGEHIGLAQRADLMIVAPATANYLAHVANGFAGDLLSTLALTITCPLLLAPAMNCDRLDEEGTSVGDDTVEVMGPADYGSGEVCISYDGVDDRYCRLDC